MSRKKVLTVNSKSSNSVIHTQKSLYSFYQRYILSIRRLYLQISYYLMDESFRWINGCELFSFPLSSLFEEFTCCFYMFMFKKLNKNIPFFGVFLFIRKTRFWFNEGHNRHKLETFQIMQWCLYKLSFWYCARCLKYANPTSQIETVHAIGIQNSEIYFLRNVYYYYHQNMQIVHLRY